MAIAPGNTLALAGLGYAYAVAGRRLETEKVLDRLNELSKDGHIPSVLMAEIYAGLMDKDKAFDWLQNAYEERSIGAIKVNPAYDPLRSDPRFADLLRRMNLQS